MLLAFAWPAQSQFSGLSATGDGSAVYFSSPLRLRGSSQSFDAKVFRATGGGAELFRAQDPGRSLGWYSEFFYDLAAPDVSRDGSVIAFTGVRACGGGSGCLAVQRAQGTVTDSRGRTLASAFGYVNLSPNGRFAVFFARNTFAGIATPTELISTATGERLTIPYAISAQARRRVADDGTVAAYTPGGVRLWRATGEQTLKLSIAAPPDGTEPLLLLSGDARRLVYRTAAGLTRYDLTTGEEESLGSGAPSSVSMNEDGTLVAYVDGAGGQVWLAPGRQLTREPEGFREVTLSGDGRVAFAVTRSGRLLRIDVAAGRVTEWIPRTPWIVNAGVFSAVAPGSLFALEGVGLAEATSAASTPLPRELGGVRVRIGGTDAAVQAVSPERVLIQTPWETPLDSAARFDFLSGNSPFETGPGTVNVAPRAPYAWNVAVHQDWRGLVTAADPARAGEAITLYFAGLGPVSPGVATGEAAPGENPARVTEPLHCQFWDGGPNDSRLYFAGLAPGMVGVYQVTLEVAPLRLSPAAVACDIAGAGAWTLVDVVPGPPL